MNRLLHHAAFAAGLAALAWVGAGYGLGNPLALALVVLIAAFYLAGALELRRFRAATTQLGQALDAAAPPPAALDDWLARVPAALRTGVRLRVEGERVALPGPALAPTLAGLLVLLGMLGSFLGMVVTLQGTGLALEHASDVEAIRASLAAPVKGLGLAFGTSVAGVAASAMLGLMAALARRERQQAARRLDAAVATTLRGFSRAHQREQALQLLQAQAEAMPALVTQLGTLVAQLEHRGQALHEELRAGQARFQDETRQATAALAESVGRSLQESLAEGARVAGAAIEPAVQATLAGLARESSALQATLAGAVQRQLEGSGAQLADGLARFEARLDERSAALLQHLAQAQDERAAAAQAHDDARSAALHEALGAQQQRLAAAFEAGTRRLAEQTEAQSRETLAQVGQLLAQAADAPRAAAAVIGELRGALSESLARDNAALEERNRLLATLGELLDALRHAGGEQRAAIDALVQAAGEQLERSGAQFTHQVEDGAQRLQAAAGQASQGLAEVARLGEGFGAAVQAFGQASTQMTAQLQRIEAALDHSLARSDEQLAYYVAQAREIVDLTLGSQKQIVEDLQQVARVAARAEADAA